MPDFTQIKGIKFNSIDNVAFELKKMSLKPENYGDVLANAYSASPYKSKMIAKGLLKNATDLSEKNNLLFAVNNSMHPGVRLEVVRAYKESGNHMELVTALSQMTTKDASGFFKDYFEVGGKVKEVTLWLANISELYVQKKKEHQIDPDYDGFWDDVWNTVVGVVDTIGEAINTVVDAVIKAGKALSEVMDSVLNYTQRTINNIIEALIDAGKGVAELILSTAAAIGGSIEGAFKKLFKGILSAGKKVYDIMKALYEEVTGYIGLGITVLVKIRRRIKDILTAAWNISKQLLQQAIAVLVELDRSIWYILNWAKNLSEEALRIVFEKLIQLNTEIADLISWCVRRSLEITVKGFKVLIALGYTVGVIVTALVTDPDNVYSKGLKALMELGGTMYDFFLAASSSGVELTLRVYHSLRELGLDLPNILKLAAEKGFEYFKPVVMWLLEAGVKILDDLIFACGFEYDDQQDIFYSRLDPWQSNLGYFTIYDVSAPLVAMIIHCEPLTFKYDNRSWKIEFWKGQYGICTGAEIGVYTGEFQIDTGDETIDHTLNGYDFGGDTECASGEDMLQMSFVLKKGNEVVFTRDSDNPATNSVEKHWWLTGFKPMELSGPSDLLMDIAIVLKDALMLDAFVGALKRVGYRENIDFNTVGNKVNVVFNTPYTPQPWPW